MSRRSSPHRLEVVLDAGAPLDVTAQLALNPVQR
jgi:hypothetical protein